MVNVKNMKLNDIESIFNSKKTGWFKKITNHLPKFILNEILSIKKLLKYNIEENQKKIIEIKFKIKTP